MISPAEPWWTPQPVDPRSWYSTLYPNAKHQYPSRFETGPNSSWHRCYSPVVAPQSRACESPDGECVRISKLEPAQLRRGGCFLLHGVHRLGAPLELPCPIRLVGQSGELGGAVISGGAHLHSWAEHAQGGERLLVSAPLEARSVRQLFLGSRHAERGQLTRLRRGEQNLYGPTERHGQRWSADRTFELTPTAFGYTAPLPFCEWAKREPGGGAHLEAVYASRPWSEGRCAVLRVQSDGASCVVLMAQPCHHSICPSARAARYNSTTCPEQRAVRLENVRQGLGEGQWMQRHDGRVLLRMNSTASQEGEARHHKGELSAADGSPQILLSPQSHGLLRGVHVSVTGVRFVLSAFSGTATAVGWPDTQAGHAATGIRDGKAAPRGEVCPVLAAVVSEQGHVANCSFAHLGGAGVHLRSGVVEGSTFADLSGGGVLLGTHDPETPSSGAVRCNVIQHVGVEYTGSTGIAAGYMRGALIQGNLLAHLPYSAISMGWGWGQFSMCPARTGSLPGCTAAGDNVIESNAVLSSDICRVNHDGGAIYTLGQQPNSSIRFNCIAGVRNRGECMVIYNDDGSFGITSEANKVSVGSLYLIKGAHPDPRQGNPTRGTRALACKPTATTLPRVTDLPANEPGPHLFAGARALAPPPAGFITDPAAVHAQCGDEYVCASTIQEVCPGSTGLLAPSSTDAGGQ